MTFYFCQFDLKYNNEIVKQIYVGRPIKDLEVVEVTSLINMSLCTNSLIFKGSILVSPVEKHLVVFQVDSVCKMQGKDVQQVCVVDKETLPINLIILFVFILDALF